MARESELVPIVESTAPKKNRNWEGVFEKYFDPTQAKIYYQNTQAAESNLIKLNNTLDEERNSPRLTAFFNNFKKELETTSMQYLIKEMQLEILHKVMNARKNTEDFKFPLSNVIEEYIHINPLIRKFVNAKPENLRILQGNILSNTKEIPYSALSAAYKTIAPADNDPYAFFPDPLKNFLTNLNRMNNYMFGQNHEYKATWETESSKPPSLF